MLVGMGESKAYQIATDGAVIYEGIAVSRPNDDIIEVVINDICAAYLQQYMPPLVEGVETAPYVKTFDVIVDGNVVHSVEFVMDYSYDYALADIVHSLSDPVDSIIDYRMPLLRTNVDGSYDFHVYNVLGDAYDDSYNNDFAIELTTALSGVEGNYVKGVSNYLGKVIAFESANELTTYRVLHTCAKYALYYVNAFGGWDSLVMQGTPKHSEGIKRYSLYKSYDNAQQKARGLHNYANDLTKNWELKTALLNDEQSARMYHLLGSTHVYLYDIETAELLPVVLTDTAATYATYRNNNGKRTQYTINVQLAANRLRR